MKREKAIEIPFGAKDSELIKWEYTIPEGMEAEIKDGKVIIKKAESEDERIRKELKEAFEAYDIESTWNGIPIRSIFAWLEKQKEQKPAEWSDYKDKVNIPYCSSEPEWSEEDTDILNCCISSIEEAKENRYAYKETDGDTSYDREIAWLKSIHPPFKVREMKLKILKYLSTRCSSFEFEEVEDYLNNLRPSWKPSEWQMSMLLAVINEPNNAGSESCHLALKSIYDDLKKLT